MTTPQAAFLLSTYEGPGPVIAEAGRLALIEEDDLVASDPARWAGLIISMHADQVFLARHGDWFETVLDHGGRLVLCGHVERPFVRGLMPFVPLARPRVRDLAVSRLAPHPVFDRWPGDALTFRKGVAGFFGRGHNPPPPGAKAINGLGPALVPVDWEWDRPGGGRLLVHGGNDLWVTFERDAENEVLVEALLGWLGAARRREPSESAA